MRKSKQKKISVRKMLVLTSVLPLMLSIAIISVVSVFVTKSNLEKQVENTLYVASNILSAHCSGNNISAVNEMSYYEYLDSLKAKNIDMAIVFENATCASSIRNENDYRVKEIDFNKSFTADKEELEKGFFDSEVTINGEDYFGYYMPIITDGKLIAMAFAGQNQEEVNSAIISSVVSFSLLAVGLVVAFGAVAILFSNGIVKTVNSVDRSITALANGDLKNHSTGVSSSVKELATLLFATNVMQENLNDVIGKAKDISKELVSDIEDVTRLSNSSSGRAKQITNALDELSLTAANMAENVQDINVQMIEIGNGINDISEDVEHLYHSSENILKVNDEAKADMDVIMNNSYKSVKAVEDILSQIRETNDSIAEIDKAVSLILSIADQTSLLSLNASIEAARAGEAGRGFAVVAGEIGSLSAQSAEGAEMIKNLAQTITEKSSLSVELATGIAELITEEQDSISKTKGKYEELSRDINDSASKIKNIADKTENLTSNKEKVIENVQNLSAISEENYASNEEVSANVGEIIEEVNLVNENCAKMNRMAQELDESVAYFHN